MKKIVLFLLVAAAVFFMAGCATPDYYTRHNDRRDRDRYRYENRYERHHHYYSQPHYRDRRGTRVDVNVRWY
jgi:hypothetical protein